MKQLPAFRFGSFKRWQSHVSSQDLYCGFRSKIILIQLCVLFSGWLSWNSIRDVPQEVCLHPWAFLILYTRKNVYSNFRIISLANKKPRSKWTMNTSWRREETANLAITSWHISDVKTPSKIDSVALHSASINQMKKVRWCFSFASAASFSSSLSNVGCEIETRRSHAVVKRYNWRVFPNAKYRNEFRSRDFAACQKRHMIVCYFRLRDWNLKSWASQENVKISLMPLKINFVNGENHSVGWKTKENSNIDNFRIDNLHWMLIVFLDDLFTI